MRYLPLFLLPLVAFGAPSNLSSDLPMEFDGKTNELVARQNATFTHDDLVLIADEIRYRKTDNVAVATGNARINFKACRLVAKQITYTGTDGHFKAEDFRLGMYPFLIKGELAEGTPDRIEIHHATLIASQTGQMAPAVSIGKIVLKPGQRNTYLRLERALAKFDKIPFVPIPLLAAPIPNTDFPQMDFSVGRSGSFGEYVRTSTLIGAKDGFSSGANLDYYSRRGWLFGPNIRWQTGSFLTQIASGYISDTGDTGTDIQGRNIDDSRGFVQAKTKGELGKVQLTAKVDYWSDSEVLRDFRPDTYRDDPSPDTFVEAVIPFKNAYLSAFARVNPNNFDEVTERLPEVRLDKISTELGDSGITYSWFNSAAVLEQNDSSHLNRLDSILSLRKNINLYKWWQFSPIASGRVTRYSKADDDSGSFTRLLGEVGFDSTWTFSRLWDTQNATWGINGLRHLIQPTLQYRYLPNGNSDSNKIIDLDEDVFDETVLYPIDLWEMTDTDEIEKRNLIRFGIKQSLQTRQSPKQGFPSRDLITFDVYQDFNLATNEDLHTIGDFYLLTTIAPADWLKVGGSVRLNWEDTKWEESSIWSTFHDADQWSVTLKSRFRDDDTNQYGILASYRLTDTWSILTDTTYDAYEHDLTDMTVGFEQRMRSGWKFFYGFTRRDGDERNSRNELTFRVSAIEF